MFINESKKAIEMSEKEYNLAMTHGTEEYKALKEIRSDYPGFTTQIVSSKKTVKVKDKLNLKEMKAYVKANGTDDQKADFEAIAFPYFTEDGMYVPAKPFFEVKKWFYAQFPKYKEELDKHNSEIEKIFEAVDQKIENARKEALKKRREERNTEVAKFRTAA